MPKKYADESSIIPDPVFKESQWGNGKVMTRTLQNFTRRVTKAINQTKALALEGRDLATEVNAQATKSDTDLTSLQNTVSNHTTSIATNSTNIATNSSDIAENKVYTFFMGV